jgi:hypothetical protein
MYKYVFLSAEIFLSVGEGEASQHALNPWPTHQQW